MSQVDTQQAIQNKLARLYGEKRAPEVYDRLKKIIGPQKSDSEPTLPVSEQDVMLITYGDMVQESDEAPLKTLHSFLKDNIYPTVNSVHILPFFPYSSDDGFSVIDYKAVNPEFGDWEHVEGMSKDFKLMFDAVFNHISAHSEWFQKFLEDDPKYRNYFVVVPAGTDVSMVVRPRALPLLTLFRTPSGEKLVWTTFSEDQIDVNASNPDVVLDLIEILLFYVEKGARYIRLDAIAFLWKKLGTPSIHLEETHLVIQLMRDVLTLVAPDVVFITETNVPHEENISYFGDGTNEAQMVYQFPLPPLTLHTLRTGNASKLTKWAASLEPAGALTSFFNFSASHDGIGMRPVTGILSDAEIQALVDLATEHGGHVSFKNNSDGSQSPYELNVSYFDAITNPKITASDPDIAVKRFIVSQAIVMVMAGVPGIYFHSLFGSRNYNAGVEKTGRYRTINREKLDVNTLRTELSNADSLRSKVFNRYIELLKIRTSESAFHPLAAQKIHTLSDYVFAVERTSQDGQSTVFALNNVSGESVTLSVPVGATSWRDLVGGQDYAAKDGQIALTLAPYQIAWLKNQ